MLEGGFSLKEEAMRMREWGKGLLNENGAAMTEYGLLLAGIALIVFAAVVIFGDTLYELYLLFPGLFPD